MTMPVSNAVPRIEIIKEPGTTEKPQRYVWLTGERRSPLKTSVGRVRFSAN